MPAPPAYPDTPRAPSGEPNTNRRDRSTSSQFIHSAARQPFAIRPHPEGYELHALPGLERVCKSSSYSHRCGQATPVWFEDHSRLPADVSQTRAAMYGRSPAWLFAPTAPFRALPAGIARSYASGSLCCNQKHSPYDKRGTPLFVNPAAEQHKIGGWRNLSQSAQLLYNLSSVECGVVNALKNCLPQLKGDSPAACVRILDRFSESGLAQPG
jgi:hypothetical protein